MVAPVIPGLNDHEIPAILERGALSASWTLVRLPAPVDDFFVDWLDRHFPERRWRVVGHIRECRNGQLSDARFGHRMRGKGVYADHIAQLFRSAARRAGLDAPLPPLSSTAFRRPPQPGDQLVLYPLD